MDAVVGLRGNKIILRNSMCFAEDGQNMVLIFY